MEKTVQFRDYQKVQTSDLNNIEVYARQSFDDLVGDAVTASLRYAGFNTVKSNTAEITVAPGRFYGTNDNNAVGAIFSLPTQTIMSLVQYLCVSQVTQKYLTLVAYGVEDQVDVQNRDYLVNTQTLQTQPQAVAMTDSRDAVLAILAGAEAADPVAPAVNVGQVAIANILVNYAGVISVTMLTAGQVTSTENLNSRLAVVETFDTQVGPRFDSLAADLAALANQIAGLGRFSNTIIDELAQDVANLKDLAGLPSSYSQYGAVHFAFMDSTKYDINNALALGFNAEIFYGCRFPAQNADLFALSLFNPFDPNASVGTNGLLIPAHTNKLMLQTGAPATSITMNVYTWQTYSLVQKNMSYTRIVNGPSYDVCTNGARIQTSSGDSNNLGWWLPNFTSQEVETSTYTGAPGHYWYQVQYYWIDSWTEPYWELDTVTHSVSGMQVAQSFLASSDAWITQIAFYLSAIAAPSGDIWVTLCQCTNGQPDLTQVICHVDVTSTSLVVGWNTVSIQPTFVAKGARMAVVLTTGVGHQLGMAAAGSYLNGTFFYSQDGAYYLGDYTKEIALQIYSADFSGVGNQVTIEFAALNLAGGIRDIDLTARMIVPDSCQLLFEVMPTGTGTWLPITQDAPLVPFQNAPVLARFRARFVGTSNVMPGITMGDSMVNIWAPGPTFTLVTVTETLASASGNVSFKIEVESFNPVAHSLEASQGDGNGYIRLYKTSSSYISPTTVTVTEVDASAGRYDITATFSGISPTISSFIIVVHGTTNSISDVFHVSNLTWWAQ